jgi:hypothetical protein
MIPLPITEQYQQKEWKIKLFIVKNIGFPLQMIQNLRNRIMHKTQKIETAVTQGNKRNKGSTSHIIVLLCVRSLIYLEALV